MAHIHIDCIGQACPQPVLQAKTAVEEGSPEEISVTVDNDPARENVIRFLRSQGYTVEAYAEGDTWVVTGRGSSGPRQAAAESEAAGGPESDSSAERIVVFLTAETIGRGDDTLGAGLMGNFLATLPELGDSLWRIVMVNGAVKLSAEGHDHLEKLRKLEEAGVSILVCGTCLSHFELLEQKRVGQTTNMLDVVTSLQLGSKVITI